MADEKSVGGVSSDSKLFGALCYIIGVLVPLFIIFTDKKNDKFALFHAYQSLFLTVILFVVMFGFMAVTMVLTIATGGIAGFLNCLLLPIWLVVLLAIFLVAYKAFMGEKYKLPIVGDMAEKYAK
jgi:uncharacterized membrane protein